MAGGWKCREALVEASAKTALSTVQLAFHVAAAEPFRMKHPGSRWLAGTADL